MIKVNNDFKKTLIRQRSGDENIGRLIVFSITIIIALGVLGLLGYFYSVYEEESRVMSVMSSASSTAQDLQSIDLCNNATGGIDFEAVHNEYAVGCDDYDTSWDDFTSDYGQIEKVGGSSSWEAKIDNVSDGNIQYYTIEQ